MKFKTAFAPATQTPPSDSPPLTQNGCRVWKSCGRRPLTGSDPVEGDGLGRTAAEGHAHPLKQLLPGEEVLVSWENLSEAQGCVGPRRDGHLQNRGGPS